MLQDSVPAARAAVVIGTALGNLTQSIVTAATWKGSDIVDIQQIVDDILQYSMPSCEDQSMDFIATETSDICWSVNSAVKHSFHVGQLGTIIACRMAKLGNFYTGHTILHIHIHYLCIFVDGMASKCLLWVEFVKALRDIWLDHQFVPFMVIKYYVKLFTCKFFMNSTCFIGYWT